MELMEVPMRAAVLTMFFLGVAVPAAAQTDNVVNPPPPVRSVNLSGPRFGFTSLSQGIVDKLATEQDIIVRSGITQFGWQFEKQFYSKAGGIAAVNEFVFLLGGLEQGVALPSASWMVGLRSPTGLEFGIGPNITPAGVALAIGRRRDVPLRVAQRAGDVRRRALEGRDAREHAHRLQLPRSR